MQCNTYLVPRFGRGCVSRAFDGALKPPNAACWCERRMSVVWCWSMCDSTCSLGTQRQRNPLSCQDFWKPDSPPGPPLGKAEVHPSLPGLPVPRPLALLLTTRLTGAWTDSHQLTLDLNTVNKRLCLSESNRVITETGTDQSPDFGTSGGLESATASELDFRVVGWLENAKAGGLAFRAAGGLDLGTAKWD
ncbi:hypothetical protein cypCar_00046223 [Cyprinus carpio]|nr:hypothetical protein cypCar_00046223 [Cyprinus carpio]